jgi:hypothetical protein
MLRAWLRWFLFCVAGPTHGSTVPTQHNDDVRCTASTVLHPSFFNVALVQFGMCFIFCRHWFRSKVFPYLPSASFLTPLTSSLWPLRRRYSSPGPHPHSSPTRRPPPGCLRISNTTATTGSRIIASYHRRHRPHHRLPPHHRQQRSRSIRSSPECRSR